MKGSHCDVHKEPDRSEWSRSRRFGRRGLDFDKRKPLEISIQRINRTFAADIDRRSSVYLQAAVKLVNVAHVLSRPKHLKGSSNAEQTPNIPLPPISGPNTISGKVEPPHRKESAKLKGHSVQLPSGNVTTQNRAFCVLVSQPVKVNQESNKSEKISTVARKAAFLDSQSHHRPINKQSSDETPVCQKNNPCFPGAGAAVAVKGEHDASFQQARQRRALCSSDSAIETEDQGSEDKGQTERLNDNDDDDDEEYYTEQRITEWVLEVNSSFFMTGKDELKRRKPAEEQDVSTIKIIYSGD